MQSFILVSVAFLATIAKVMGTPTPQTGLTSAAAPVSALTQELPVGGLLGLLSSPTQQLNPSSLGLPAVQSLGPSALGLPAAQPLTPAFGLPATQPGLSALGLPSPPLL